MFEQTLRQGLIIGYGDPVVFLTSPISAAFLGFAVLVAVAPLVLDVLKRMGRSAGQSKPTLEI